ncbi:DUF1642 domain-containing protein [Pediococcus inopinatus]|uniref:DUF1642 domain-containing protein n=1 Tax=Pediococcus inopinatus TaxID=114090 RepID=UPI002A6A4D09|nr:DUF1642 domain-containing protein [Pediococcus inopinatus]WPP08534.1 DUF1642 domain-containing protein [Pediococcus inopinatus]
MTGEEIGKRLGIFGFSSNDTRAAYQLDWDTDYDLLKLISKVKIPKFVADYIKYCKCEACGIGQAMQPEYMTSDMPDKIERWFTENSNDVNCEHEELFAKAWIYSYEIEPEDKFILPMEGTHGADSTTMYAIKIGGYWTANKYYDDMRAALPTVTKSQIDTAPDWVKAIKPVKVSDENETN